jgi:hypothetical protein
LIDALQASRHREIDIAPRRGMPPLRTIKKKSNACRGLYRAS